METYQLESPLLMKDNNLEGTQFWNQGLVKDNDSSSGYESANASDTEFDAISKFRTRDVQQTTVKFTSTRGLSKDLKCITDMPEMCDVTFFVGPDGIPVHATRAVLAIRSIVFYQLILKHLHIRQILKQKASMAPSHSLTDRLTIPVRKYDAKVFRMLIQFVHCGAATITDTTVCGLLCGAVQFQLTDLESACWDYIHRCTSTRIGETLLESARSCSRHHRVAHDIIDTICSNLDRNPYAYQSGYKQETTV